MTAGNDVRLRLQHPSLDFWVDVRLRNMDGKWLAVADFAGSPEPAAADTPDLALFLALWPLGPSIARELAEQALV